MSDVIPDGPVRSTAPTRASAPSSPPPSTPAAARPTAAPSGHEAETGGRQPTALQATFLLCLSCLSVLGAVLIAPVQPAIARAFADQPGVALLVPVSLTVPALLIGLTAPFAGRIVDRVGRIRLLVVALVAYSIFGTAPLWLDSLPAIVASRALVGVAEAAIMTSSTTLIGDYYSGARRNKYFGLQTVASAISAVVFIGAGGALGAGNWRTPFWLYAVGLVAAVLVPLMLWEPAARVRGQLPAVPWRRIALPLLITVPGGAVFATPIVQLSFVLDAAGVGSTATIGAISAFAAVATAVGGISFARLARRGPTFLLLTSLGLACVGIAVLGLAPAVPLIVVGAVIASAGTGLLLPTLLTWTLTTLPFEQRGRATGVFTGALFFGQFLCPLLVFAFTAALGGLPAALLAMAVVAAVLLAIVVARRPAVALEG
ncbi:MFS transporter [Kineococcus siccus]|uniref:MFS transporter n=1 Tax=Kineococcus siccus TaxID=2696567 RepID=UPI00196A290F